MLIVEDLCSGIGRKPLSEIRHHSKQCQDTICKMRKWRVFVDEINKERYAATYWIVHIPLIDITISFHELFKIDRRVALIVALDCYGFVIPACYVICR